jgi:tetratricopeptide (TPR) repeat protein
MKISILAAWTFGFVIPIVFASNANFASSPNLYNLKPEPKSESKQEIPYNHTEVLSHLLIAEMAVLRNLPEIALENYMAVVKQTRDPEIAKQATEYAIEIRALKEAQQLAIIWADIEHANLQPQLIVVALQLAATTVDVKPYLIRILQLEPNQFDHNMLLILSKLSPSSQIALKTLVSSLALDKPLNPYVHLTEAQISAHLAQIKEAEKALEKTLVLKPDLVRAIELKSKIVRYKARADKPALDYLSKKLLEAPHLADLRLFYATALTDNGRTTDAIEHLNKITDDPKVGSKALINLSEIYIENNQLPEAKKILKQALINNPDIKLHTVYLLGYVSERQNNIDEAIQWYSKVSEGPDHITAYLRASLLLTMKNDFPAAIKLIRSAEPSTNYQLKQLLLTEIDILISSDELESALRVANQAISSLPIDIDLLYARSIVSSLQDNAAQAEHDLKIILSLEPNHANALNALGYTLANQPDRSMEAMQYLKQALNMFPNNPAYMDSMGWLLYRMGKLQDSSVMLTNAYNLSNDSEIAAHLGEVLWISGQKEAALDVWQKALLQTPNHNKILETLDKLEIKIATP